LLNSQGVSVKVAGERLGHGTITITMAPYSRSDEELQHDAAQKPEQALLGKEASHEQILRRLIQRIYKRIQSCVGGARKENNYQAAMERQKTTKRGLSGVYQRVAGGRARHLLGTSQKIPIIFVNF